MRMRDSLEKGLLGVEELCTGRVQICKETLNVGFCGGWKFVDQSDVTYFAPLETHLNL